MARIRTIKPEFFTSEDIVALSPMARLLYIACWCEADKEGRMVWKPRTMKLRYFPADDCDIDALARELVAAELVVPYGDGLAYIPGSGKHQHLNPRESASVLPNPDASARVSDASLPVIHAQGGREGKGREGNTTYASDDAKVELADVAIPLNDGTDYAVTLAEVAEFERAYPVVDVLGELRKARAWCVANPTQRKTRRGAGKFVNGWLARAAERAPKPAPVDRSQLPGGGRRAL